MGCTKLADMLPSKYEDNTLQIKEKVQKELLRFLYLKLPPVPLPIFWAFSPTPLFCSTAKSVWLSAIIWPWLPMRLLRVLSSWTKAISADGVSKEFVDRQNHINGIENFWNQAKRVLRKYNGIDRKSFPLFLKECEFRFNFGTPSRQLKILRDWCGV